MDRVVRIIHYIQNVKRNRCKWRYWFCVIANACWFGHGIVLQKCAVLLLQFRIFLNRKNVGGKFSIIRQNENMIFIFFTSTHCYINEISLKSPKEKKSLFVTLLDRYEISVEIKISITQTNNNYITHFSNTNAKPFQLLLSIM